MGLFGDNFYSWLENKHKEEKTVLDAVNGMKHKDGTPCKAKSQESCPEYKTEKKEAEEVDGLEAPSKEEKKEGHTKREKAPPPNFKEVDREEFISTLKVTKQSQSEDKRWRVDIHETDWQGEPDLTYNECKNFVTDGGSTVSVKPNGDIISVCKRKGEHLKATSLMRHAVAQGGDRLDSFDGNWAFYRKCGFEPISWTPFNVEFAPEGWREGVDKQEPVVFFAYTGNFLNLEPGEETEADKKKFYESHKPYDGNEGYDNAMTARDEFINNKKGN